MLYRILPDYGSTVKKRSYRSTMNRLTLYNGDSFFAVHTDDSRVFYLLMSGAYRNLTEGTQNRSLQVLLAGTKSTSILPFLPHQWIIGGQVAQCDSYRYPQTLVIVPYRLTTRIIRMKKFNWSNRNFPAHSFLLSSHQSFELFSSRKLDTVQNSNPNFLLQ